jgi:hypothetical protein
MNLKTQILGIVGAAALSLTMVAPAFAQTATTTVNPGTLSASIGSATLSSATYSNTAAGTVTGTMQVTVDDARGTDAGWTVNISSGNFVHGTDTTKTIAATNFSQPAAASNVTLVAGNDAATTVRAKAPGANLGTAYAVLDALAGNGDGKYTADVGVSLNVPAKTPTGTYNATVTMTTGAAPTA